jgi:DNA primase
MYKEQLIVWAKSNNIDFSISGKEMKMKCLNPEHQDSNPSFSINMVTGLAYCFSCGFKGHANRILNIQQDEDQVRLSKYMELNRQWQEQVVGESEVSIVLPPVDFYINETIRGIPKELLKELGVYYCSYGRYQGRLIFPIRDTKGKLLGFDARIYEHQDREVKPMAGTEHAKYLRPTGMLTKDTLYPLDYLWAHRADIDLSTVVITEGIIDAISYIALGIPAVCNFGLSHPSPQKAGYLLSLGTEAICNGLDADSAGIKAWQGDEEKGKEGLKHVWKQYLSISRPLDIVKTVKQSGYKDANEYLESLSRL